MLKFRLHFVWRTVRSKRLLEHSRRKIFCQKSTDGENCFINAPSGDSNFLLFSAKRDQSLSHSRGVMICELVVTIQLYTTGKNDFRAQSRGRSLSPLQTRQFGISRDVRFPVAILFVRHGAGESFPRALVCEILFCPDVWKQQRSTAIKD